MGKKKILSYAFTLVFTSFQLFSQDIGLEKNPYNSTLPPGSVVQVVFDLDFDIYLRNRIFKELRTSEQSQKIREKYLNFLPKGLKKELTNFHNKIIRNDKRLHGVLAATLGNFDAESETYPITIFRNFNFNNEKENIILTGKVNQAAFNKDDQVNANQIANINFTFNSLNEQFSIAPNDIENFDLSPSGITNQNNNILKKSKRQEIFIKYFNWILKDLFN